MPPSTTSTTTSPESTTTTRSRLTTRSRIGGSRAGGLRLSIVAFIFTPPSNGLSISLSVIYICTQISDASADACMPSSYVFEPSRPWLVILSLYDFYLCFRVVLWYLQVSP
jgi:hypothetical protein